MYFSTRNRPLVLGFFCFLALLVSACGTAQHAAKLETGYSPPPDVKFQLGEIKNNTGRVYDVDVEMMLTGALAEALQNHNLLATSTDSNVLILNAEILAYEKGSAFGRWLMPGVGSTLLEVHCELRDGDKVVGVADAKRTVDAGGAYTIGAWASIYKDVATDITEDFSAQIGKNSYGSLASTANLKQASAPSLDPQTQQILADRTTLKVAIFYSLSGNAYPYPQGEQTMIGFAEGYIRRHEHLELKYSYYSDNFDAVEPGTKLWSGRTKHQPLKDNVYRTGAQIGADIALMYFYSVASVAQPHLFTFEVFLFDIKNRREYRSEGTEKNYKQETGRLFNTVLRNNDL